MQVLLVPIDRRWQAARRTPNPRRHHLAMTCVSPQTLELPAVLVQLVLVQAPCDARPRDICEGERP